MYDRILVPTDGSEPSEAAADHAVEIADRFGATIHALYVVDRRGPGARFDAVVEAAEAEGEAAVERVGDAAGAAGVATEKHLRRGVPHEEVVAAAGEYGADLVVMGTHGRTGFDRVVSAGSTTERVVRLAAVPVLVVGGAGRDEAA